MDKILEEVKNKHGLVLSRGVNILFTALVGSQNYGLATEASDVDTYSFVLPSYDNFLLDKKIPNYEIQLDDTCSNSSIFLIASSSVMVFESTIPISLFL